MASIASTLLNGDEMYQKYAHISIFMATSVISSRLSAATEIKAAREDASYCTVSIHRARPGGFDGIARAAAPLEIDLLGRRPGRNEH